jgi:pimeloyl-ACP methyl ester carboxylesterase
MRHLFVAAFVLVVALPADSQTGSPAQAPGASAASAATIPSYADVKPGSITYEDVPYPYPVHYLSFTTYGQDVRMAYMDVPPAGRSNGHTVVLFHGMNFGGFYWGETARVLANEGFRVVITDQIGFGRSSKAIIPYNFSDMALNTRRILLHLNLAKVAIVGHSMGGMLAARFSTQYPDMVERLVIYNPIGLADLRFNRPATSIDEAYKRNLSAGYEQLGASYRRYFSHNPSAWKPEYEQWIRQRYAMTLGAEWPRLAMVQSLLGQMTYNDPVVYDWANIKSPTFVYGGREDGEGFAERMKYIADTIPGGKGRLHLIPGIGHVPHFEAPEKFYPPLVAFLKEGLS